MKLLFYILYLIFIIIPGVLLTFSAYKFKSSIHSKSGGVLLAGSILILLNMILGTGNFLIASVGTTQDLANFAMINGWIGLGLQYLGLLLLAVGLFLYVSTTKTENVGH